MKMNGKNKNIYMKETLKVFCLKKKWEESMFIA